MAMTQPIRDKEQVQALVEYYQHQEKFRNYVLIVMGMHTALRISDLLQIRWDDVYDFNQEKVLSSITLCEKKTGKSKIVALNELAVSALTMHARESAIRGDYIIQNPRTGRPLSRIQAYRLVRAAAENSALETRASCHSLRKTFGYHAWKSGVSPAIIMEIYNHSSLAMTRRYLGITQEDLNEAYMMLALFP